MTSLDRAINSDVLVVSKSLLPYLNIDKQKPMAIFIKTLELIYTINLFSNEASVRSLSRSQETGWEKSFLHDVKSNLSQDKAYFVDAILKIAEAKDLLANPETSNNVDTPPSYHLHPLDSGVPESMPFPDETTHQPPKSPLATPKTATKAASPQSNGPSPDQIINSLSSVLDPNQAQLLKVLTSLFNTSNK